MRQNSFILPFLVILMLFVSTEGRLKSQTAGNFTFSVTTTSTGGFTPKHILAIWIEDNSASFVKTKVLYSSVSNLDHLGNWISKTGSNTVDAISGATLTTHGNISFIWNGTNISGIVVPDGTYTVWVEMAWASSLTTGKSINSFSFTKGPAAFNSNPASTANLNGISLTWTPGASAINNETATSDFRVFPNPAQGFLNIDFKRPLAGCVIQIINDAGVQVLNERLYDVQIGIKTIDISSLAPGIYYITFHMPDKNITSRIIKMR
jgi:hypothetical protein